MSADMLSVAATAKWCHNVTPDDFMISLQCKILVTSKILVLCLVLLKDPPRTLMFSFSGKYILL